jgi:hypothetical protein
MKSRIVALLIAGILAAGVLSYVAGCGSSTAPTPLTGTGRVGVILTDAVSLYEHVLVTITRIEVHSPGAGWVTVATEQDLDAFIPQPIDLLTLQAVEKLVGMATIPVGTYDQMRLILAPDAEVVLLGGQTVPLKVPSGSETGLKTPAFVVPAGQVVYLLVDIKTDRIVYTASQTDKFILPPTAIEVTVFTGPFGSLRGTVLPIDSAAEVTAFFAGTEVPVAQVTINPDGTYEIPDLLAGSYYLKVAATGFEPFDSRPTVFEVTAGAATTVPPITLTPTPPSP